MNVVTDASCSGGRLLTEVLCLVENSLWLTVRQGVVLIGKLGAGARQLYSLRNIEINKYQVVQLSLGELDHEVGKNRPVRMKGSLQTDLYIYWLIITKVLWSDSRNVEGADDVEGRHEDQGPPRLLNHKTNNQY